MKEIIRFILIWEEVKAIYTDELEKINWDDSDIALTISLKAAVAKKLRFRIPGFSQAEYSYLLSNKGYIVSYKNYNISKADKY